MKIEVKESTATTNKIRVVTIKKYLSKESLIKSESFDIDNISDLREHILNISYFNQENENTKLHDEDGNYIIMKKLIK